MIELLTHCSNRDIAECMLMLIPEAWQNDTEMSEDHRAFWKFNSCMMEPWDGRLIAIGVWWNLGIVCLEWYFFCLE